MRVSRCLLSRTAIMASVGAAVFVFASQRPVFAQFGGGGLQSPRDEPVSFTFPGGTLKEYVALVKEKFGNQAQIILAPDIEGFTIDPVEFESVSAFAPMQLLPPLANGQIEVDVVGGIWRVAPPPFHTRVFSVRKFIRTKSGEPQEEAIRALISAVEATLALGSQSIPNIKIKIHPETGLLLVSGTQQQVEIVEEIVSQLDTAEEPAAKTKQVGSQDVAQLHDTSD